MPQLNINLPPNIGRRDFDEWTSQLTQYLRDYLGFRESLIITDFGTNADAINAAILSLTGGGRIIFPPGTYTVASGSIIINQNNITLELQSGSIIDNITGTDFTIKITGNNCSIVGPGTIRVPDSPAIGASSLVSLRKAAIWNTGDFTRIENVTLQNSISYGIFNEGGDNLLIKGNRFLGDYTVYDIGDGNNHFAYYQDGGTDNQFLNNYVEYWVMGFGSGTFGQAAGDRMIVIGNEFDHLGQHAVYIDNGGDHSIISNNTQAHCGSSFALTGTGMVVEGNTIHLNSPLWTTGTTYQSGLGMRNSYNCVVKGNVFSGDARYVVLAFENVSAGTTISGNIIEGNTINMGDGTCYAAIRFGSPGTSTRVIGNQIKNNIVSVGIEDSFKAVGAINITAKAADQAIFNSIDGNTVTLTTVATGIGYKWGAFGSVRNNIIQNTTAEGAIYGIRIDQSRELEVSGNIIYNSPTNATTFYGIVEIGTNVQVYKNHYLDNKVWSATTGTNFLGLVLIAGNNSLVKNLIGNEALDTATSATFRLHHGHVFHVIGATRNFNPATDVFPINYQIDIYNSDVGTITFDSSGLNKAVAAGKHGIFSYTGNSWYGSVVD